MNKLLSYLLMITVSLIFSARANAVTIQQIKNNSCIANALQAEAKYGIPKGLLVAITFVESAHKGLPQPWTLNIHNKAIYNDNRHSALSKMTNPKTGNPYRKMAVGCGQIYYSYHGKNFSSIQKMIHPRHNLFYAAKLLVQNKKTYGSWTKAVAHYHASAKQKTAQRQYTCKVLHWRVRLGFSRLPSSSRRLCSGQFKKYLKVSAIKDGPRIGPYRL